MTKRILIILSLLFFAPSVSFATTSSFQSATGNPSASTTADVAIANDGLGSWSLAHDPQTANNAPNDNGQFVAAEHVAGGYRVYRLFNNFDTSGIGAGQTIASATISFYFTQINDGLSDRFVVFQNNVADAHSMVAGDFGSVLTSTSSPVSGGSLNVASTTINQYTTITLNATALGWINKTGVTKLGLTLGKDFDNVDPGGTGPRNLDLPQYAGDANPPILSVTYNPTAAPSAAPKMSVVWFDE